MKSKTKYICTSCDAVYPSWQGKCTQCGEWNTIVRDNFDNSKLSGSSRQIIDVYKINEKIADIPKFSTSLASFNKILSGGLVKGQIILFAGEPGIGKSTLLTQLCSSSNIQILYVCGEESIDQISRRAMRINPNNYSNTDFTENTDLESMISLIESKKYDLIIIDSIQSIHYSQAAGFAGSMNQIRECSYHISQSAKKSGVAVIMIGQITKEGGIAGPKVLEHLVDTVLYFEGDRKNDTRILRVQKNRFGSTNELAIYRMEETGLVEILDIERFFADEIINDEGVSYSIYCEGSIYFIVEIQALCTKSTFAYPKRVSNGYDSKRLEMLIAILTKKLGFKLDAYDIYINIVGGLKIEDTSADLAVAAAIISSYKNKRLPESSVFIGELSLTAQIRNVSHQKNRLDKAKKFGFKKVFCSDNMTHLKTLFTSTESDE